MKFKKLESGRSMVEMLGVLAIIGVLSVGGIAGYSLSMRRHRANGVVDLVSKYSLIIYGQCMKKFLDGEISPQVASCKDDQVSSFADAGIGALPSGVTEIGLLSGISLDSESGYDKVSLKVNFSDQKLCQAVGSIAGSGCSNGAVSFEIKQN